MILAKYKYLVTFLCIFLVVFISACTTEQHELKSDDNALQNLSVQKQIINTTSLKATDVDFLKRSIGKIRYNDIQHINSIINIEKWNDLYHINYSTKQGIEDNVAVTKLLTSTNEVLKKNVNFKQVVYCTGACSCKLEGIIDGDNTYSQCDCTDCKMIIANEYPDQKNEDAAIDIEALAIQSFETTFGKKASQITIDYIAYETYDTALVSLVHYSDKVQKDLVSTFMVVQSLNSKNNDIVVDCLGNCDCRERFFPTSGAVECTCSPCEMKIIDIK